MKSLSLEIASRVVRLALILAVPCCGGNGKVGTPGGSGAGGSGGQGGGAATACDLPIGTACDCSETPTCAQEQVKGIPCCEISRMCGGEDSCAVVWTGAICEAWCDSSCERALDPEQCAAIGCMPTADGCATPPP